MPALFCDFNMLSCLAAVQSARYSGAFGRGVLVPESHRQVLCREAGQGTGPPPEIHEAQISQGQGRFHYRALRREGTVSIRAL